MKKDIDKSTNNEEVVKQRKKKSLFKRKKTLYVPDMELIDSLKVKSQELDESVEISEFDENDLTIKIAENTDTLVQSEEQKVVQVDSESDNSISKSETFKMKLKNFFIKVYNFFIPKKDDDKKRIIIKIISMVCALALVASLVYIVVYYTEFHSVKQTIKKVQNIYELNRDDYSYNSDGQFSKFDVLKEQNRDIAGWITIDNTDVDNPFYQTDNNDFYINHDINKQSNRYGALFLDYRCNINPLTITQNQIIYGHNMREGAMFGTLDFYRELSFYQNHPVISIDTLYEKRKYKIFAVMVVNSTDDNTFGYNFSAYRTSFTSQEEFLLWASRCKDRSLYDIPVDIQAGDEIITLSTCCYDYDEARFVLMGRLIREGESENIDVASAAVNKDVIYSKQWYDKKKKPVPALPEGAK